MFRAVLENNVKNFREIVETHAKQAILQTDEEGFLPLHVAAGVGLIYAWEDVNANYASARIDIVLHVLRIG